MEKTIQEATASEVQQITNSRKIQQNSDNPIRRSAVDFFFWITGFSHALQAPEFEKQAQGVLQSFEGFTHIRIPSGCDASHRPSSAGFSAIERSGLLP